MGEGGGEGGKGGRSSRAAIRTPRPRTRQPSNTTIVPNRQATISTGNPSQTPKNKHDGSPGEALPIPASCHKDAAVPPRPFDTALQIRSQQQPANFELRLKPEHSKTDKMAKQTEGKRHHKPTLKVPTRRHGFAVGMQAPASKERQ